MMNRKMALQLRENGRERDAAKRWDSAGGMAVEKKEKKKKTTTTRDDGDRKRDLGRDFWCRESGPWNLHIKGMEKGRRRTTTTPIDVDVVADTTEKKRVCAVQTDDYDCYDGCNPPHHLLLLLLLLLLYSFQANKMATAGYNNNHNHHHHHVWWNTDHLAFHRSLFSSSSSSPRSFTFASPRAVLSDVFFLLPMG